MEDFVEKLNELYKEYEENCPYDDNYHQEYRNEYNVIWNKIPNQMLAIT